MALTENERKTARAYNVGYTLSTYDPKLLDKIIKANPNNEFVKVMQVGRDHHHFNVNIPRKDYTPEFKNGFFNGRTLAQHEPKMIEKLLNTKGLNKDYRKGLDAARKEHEVLSIQEKIKQEPKAPKEELKKDWNFQKGFNIGYRLAESHGFALGHLERTNQQYSKYMDGMKAGREQYERDLTVLQEREPEGRLFPQDPVKSQYELALSDNKLRELDSIAESQNKVLIRKDEFLETPPPKWLQEREPVKQETNSNANKNKNKNRGIDLDR